MPESKKDYLYSIAKNIYGSYSVPKSSDYTFTSQTILNAKVHEPDTLEFITNNCSNGGIVHAGAGFGDFFPALSKSCKSTVWTFEPDDENYFCAKKTIELNHLKNINLFNYGLGQNKKQVYLQIKKDNKSLGPRCEISEVFISEEGTSYQPISLHSLDTIIPETSKISIIHLDVEGYELEVLKGAKRIIEKDAPIIILEIHSQALEYNNFMLQINYKPTDQLIYNFGSVVFVNTVYRLG